MTPKKVEINNSETINETPIYVEKKYQLERDGKSFERFRIEMKSDAVAILLLNKECDRILLPTEFRSGTMKYSHSIIAGKINTGETPEQAALREIKEETGYGLVRKDTLVYQLKYANSEGYSSEVTYVYVAVIDDTENVGKTHFDKDEDVSYSWCSVSEFCKHINDAMEKDNLDCLVSPATFLGTLFLTGGKKFHSIELK